MRNFGRTALIVGLLGLVGSLKAEAGFVATLAGVTGGNFTYTLDFTTATDSSSGTPVERLDNTGKVTIFDFNPGTSAMPTVTLTPTAAGNFAVTETLVGPSYPGASPLTGDSGSLYNITFTYIGGSTTMATSFTGVSIASTLTGTTQGSTVGQDTRNSGALAGTAVVSSANVLVPAAVPEPASYVLLGIGGIVGLVMRRRSRVAIA